MEISFDGVSLMTSPYNVKEWSVDNLEQRELNLYNLSRRRGGNILLVETAPKKFVIRGSIQGSSQADLEEKIDEFKELLGRKSKSLDYDYAGGTRRLIATAVKMNMPRKSYHISFIPFEVEFIAPDGVAFDTLETSEELSAVTDLVKTGTLTVGGTAQPDLKLTFTLNDATDIDSLSFLANGHKITVDASYADGDVVVIDARTLKVTINGTEVDYTGIFPEIYSGANLYEITFAGAGSPAIDYDLTFSFLKTYL